MRARSIILVLMGVLATPASAQVFKCVDAQGNTVFASFPCSEQAERVSVEVGSGAAPTTPSRMAPAEQDQTWEGDNFEPEHPPGFAAAPPGTSPVTSPQSLSPEQLETLTSEQRALFEQAMEFQRQQQLLADQQRRALDALEQEAIGSEQSVSQPVSYRRSEPEPASTSSAEACDRARTARGRLRDQGRRGYSASQSNSYNSRMRQARDRVREACRSR